jgi:hypothetical protein
MGGRIAMALMFLLVSSVSAQPPDDKPVTIPLDQIWANRMPGTKKIGLLVEQEPRLTGIQNALGFPPKDGEAKPAFAVQGRGLDALREAHAVIVDEKKPRDTFPAGNEVSVVFFTHETGPYVHLQKVERQKNNINIHYKFVPHEEEDTERHIALIPLGKLADGNYSVNIIRSKKSEGSKSRQPSDEYAQRVVSRPFSFTVLEQGE